MRYTASPLTSFAAAMLISAASAAQAQQPICAPVSGDERVVTSCRAASVFAGLRFLSDFTVDHLFKPAPPAFERTALTIADFFAPRELSDKALRRLLAVLAPIRFFQLDRTTGTLVADWTTNERELRMELEGLFGKVSATLRLPDVLEGGYWRGPDVLQIALWKRIGIRVDAADGTSFAGEVSCLSLSPEQLLVRFAEPGVPPLILQFRECTQ